MLDSTVSADGAVYGASEALLGLGAPQNQPCSSLGAWCLMALVLAQLASVIYFSISWHFGKVKLPLHILFLAQKHRPGVGSLHHWEAAPLVLVTLYLCTYIFLIFTPSSHLCHREIIWGSV